MNNACVRIVVTHARRYNDYVDGESERRKSEIKSSGHSNVTLQTLIPHLHSTIRDTWRENSLAFKKKKTV